MRSQKSFSLLLAVRLLGDDLGGAPPKAVICFSRFTWESRVSTAQSLRGRPTVGRVDATVGMSSSAGIVCALTSACGLQGPFTPAASCPFNKGALDEPYIGCWCCAKVCCCRCLDLVSTKAKEFKQFHAELEVDPAATKSLLAVMDGRGARAATDADTRQELQAQGVGSFDEAAGVFRFFACALCQRDGPEQEAQYSGQEAHSSGQEAQEEEEGEEEDDVEDEVLSEDEAVEDDAPGLAQFVMVASAAPLQVPSSPLPACDALATRTTHTRALTRDTSSLLVTHGCVCIVTA